MTKAVHEFINELRRMESLGFTGMCTGRIHRKRTGDAAVNLGLAVRRQLVVCDGDGFAKDPERWRQGYVLTDKGRELPDRPEGPECPPPPWSDRLPDRPEGDECPPPPKGDE